MEKRREHKESHRGHLPSAVEHLEKEHERSGHKEHERKKMREHEDKHAHHSKQKHKEY